MRSYCVKQKKQTLCLPGSERIAMTKNGRQMIVCVCAECGSTKTQFMKVKTGGGKSDDDCTCGLDGSKKPCSMQECVKRKQVRY